MNKTIIKMRKIGVICLLLFLSALTFAQTDIAKAEALFIYNFSRLIEWPATYKTGPFVIGIMGKSPVSDQLKVLTTGKQVGSQPISVKIFGSADEVSTCHILFIPFSETKFLPGILTQVSSKSTLLITEKNSAIEQGAAINFVVIGDKLKFEMSPGNAQKYDIKISSKLNEMAYKVY